MNSDPFLERERLLELLADRATIGLSAEEQEQLERLLARHPDVNPLDFDLSAALVWLTAPEPVQEMPARLRQEILQQAVVPAVQAVVEGAARTGKKLLPPVPLWLSISTWSGWVLAAGLLIAIGVDRFRGSLPPPSTTEQAERLVATSPDLVQLEGKAPDPKQAPNVSGQVLWSGQRQEGYLRLHGLRINDPSKTRYQLWIFDGSRDQRYPVDGGVFDVRGNGEVIVPIHAKLPVREPKLFAITVEPPEGVVVSDRKQIVMLASVP